ncbi:cysteine desulfurase, SufS subfamily [Rhodomicrobium vannielii ATCC 17100]|uniref:Cysteine desulfurase n=1 Tax=Rhodomicrobium vannielii (strain ATCC 17100 / DSM 162 / LMG 4299 / NCIMB 10020 / ATH 3.1.1) TaxID=648757 RepID=E3HZ39_RHOVT|nr:cysteine desulfurase [Rhodomicrobium vannielii]ADP72086.1 cysteine desulfurase, SufS subfamily [Rhodomicrobium vannielii ATCC 17100]
MTLIEKDIAAASYDVEAIRKDFPAMSLEVYGKPLVYLDNAASAQKPKAVLDAIVKSYSDEYANVHRGLHYLANAATAAYEGGRERVAKFLNAPSPEQIVFTKNATEAINLVAASFGGLHLREGDEVLLSIMEHHSNIVPWHFHRERRGVVLNWVPVTDEGEFRLEDFEAALTPKTKIVAITHMSNVLGTTTPIKDICRISHAHGAYVLIDGSQGAVHCDVDVQDIDCDFYVITGHKLYGPTGIGALYAKREHLEAMPPFLGGGEMIETVTRDAIKYNDPPYRFEAGTPMIAQAAGLTAALDYIDSIGKAKIRAHELDLLRYAEERLKPFNSLRFIGNARDKGAIVSFAMEGAHSHDVATILDRSGIAVRAGSHCAEPLLTRFGLTSTCRASFALYNTRAEVDALAEGLQKAERFFR